MNSFRAPSYGYGNDQNSMPEEAELSGILDIFVHHARNIHNICIYDKQDVYAKFSLTYNPDDTISTRIVNKGGNNPDFNQNLTMKLSQTTDAVLKCEIWMLSRARNLLEDQLLGFTLVPISTLAGKGKVSEEFSLSSTDLFHSPAGTVKLSLSLKTSASPLNSSSKQHSHVSNNSCITSEVVFLDRNIAETIEFPDINVVHQNQQMVSEYFSSGCRPSLIGEGSFLHLGVSLDDSEMTLNSSEENLDGSASPSGSSIHTSSGLLSSSTTTNLSDDNRNTADSNTWPKIPKSNENPAETRHDNENKHEAEQSAMQRQIVDMYMKSMHQFTESLEKMKLPMELDKAEIQGPKNTRPSQTSNNTPEADQKKDGSRVFYGSRAFF